MGLYLNVGHIMENHLAAIHCPFVKHFGGNVFGLYVHALSSGLLQIVREKAHFKFKAEQVNLAYMMLAALQNDFLHKQTAYGHVHRANNHHAPLLLALKTLEALGIFRLVCLQYQLQKGRFLLLLLNALFLLAQIFIDAHIMLALIFAEIENFKGAIGLAFLLELALHAKQPFSGGMDGELAKVCGNPLTAQFFSYCRECAGATEKVGHKIAFIG